MTLTWSWSASKVAFFPNELKGLYVAKGTWPADCVPVSDAVYAAALPTLPDGKQLGVDAGGQPTRVAVEPPVAAR